MAKGKITAVQFPNGETYEWSQSLWAQNVETGHAKALYGQEGRDALHAHRCDKLRELVPVKSTLTVVCTHRSSSGMSARFRVYVPIISKETGKPLIVEITSRVADVCGFRQHNGEIVMGGCGYSKSFQIGYDLGCRLWPNGTPEPHGTRNGQPDSAGGYAISVN